MNFVLLGIATVVRLLAFMNAPSPILATLLPIFSFVSDVLPEKAALPMVVTPSGTTTLVMAVLPTNALSPIARTRKPVITEGMSTTPPTPR